MGTVDNSIGDIKSFYFGANVFITGASGFVGKVLIESLLRKTDVDRIYVLIRNKKNIPGEERIKAILKDTVFRNLRREKPRRLKSVIPVNGDVSLPHLGLSSDVKNELMDKVEIIFHCAATVNFYENLKFATKINVTGTKSVLELARLMKNLKVVMHVSTAYANVQVDEIEEKIYPMERHIDIIKMMESVDQETAEIITKEIIRDSPNTYIYTKRAAEDLIWRDYRDLPVGISRPGVVISALREPIPGWIDNLYGPTSLTIAMMMGVVHCSAIKRDCKSELVPVDMVTNCLISSAWDTYIRYGTQTEQGNHKVPVYNIVSSPVAPMSWGKFQDSAINEGRRAAPSESLWYSFVTTCSSWMLFRLVALILHYLPAYLFDILLYLTGKKAKWVKIYNRTDFIMQALLPFCMREWVFKIENVETLWEKMSQQEKDLFPFTFAEFDWKKYLKIYHKGVKQFMIKDSFTEYAAMQKSLRLRVYHISFFTTFVSVLVTAVFLIFTS